MIFLLFPKCNNEKIITRLLTISREWLEIYFFFFDPYPKIGHLASFWTHALFALLVVSSFVITIIWLNYISYRVFSTLLTTNSRKI